MLLNALQILPHDVQMENLFSILSFEKAISYFVKIDTEKVCQTVGTC